MTANQYRATLAALGLTQAGVAQHLGISVRTSHGYANGTPIPTVVQIALASLACPKCQKRPSEPEVSGPC